MPERIWLRRTKGWRKPEGAIVVARPSKWGNPFPLDTDWACWAAVALGYKGNPAGRREAMVALHRAWLTGGPIAPGPLAGVKSGGALTFSGGATIAVSDHAMGIAAAAAAALGPIALPPSPIGDIGELAGHDLACWCKPGQPCHADVLLELANP